MRQPDREDPPNRLLTRWPPIWLVTFLLFPPCLFLQAWPEKVPGLVAAWGSKLLTSGRSVTAPTVLRPISAAEKTTPLSEPVSCHISIPFELSCHMHGSVLGAWVKVQGQKKRTYVSLQGLGSPESEPDKQQKSKVHESHREVEMGTFGI